MRGPAKFNIDDDGDQTGPPHNHLCPVESADGEGDDADKHSC